MDLGEFGRGLGILTRVGGHVQDEVCLDRIRLGVEIRAGSNGFLDFLVASHQGSKREGSQNVNTAFHILYILIIIHYSFSGPPTMTLL